MVCEILHKVNPNFQSAIAIDVIKESPFIERYREIIGDEFEIIYHQDSSYSPESVKLIQRKKPDITFIDGDHSLSGAFRDHMNVRNYSKTIVHHDITSDSSIETTELWNYLKQLETKKEIIEFTDQYNSVIGKFLGIGILREKSEID